MATFAGRKIPVDKSAGVVYTQVKMNQSIAPTAHEKITPWPQVATFLILALFVFGVFRIFHSVNGITVGRDGLHHVQLFLQYLYAPTMTLAKDTMLPIEHFLHPLGFFDFLRQLKGLQYGPALNLLFFFFWNVFGNSPASFAGANLLAGLALLGVLAALLRRNGVHPAWMLVLGALLIGSNLGLVLYCTVNVDTLYTLGALLGLFVLITPTGSIATKWLWMGLILMLGVSARLNTLIYFAAPLMVLLAQTLKEICQGKVAGRNVWRAFSGHPVLVVLVVLLMGANLLYYLPYLHNLTPGKIISYNDFQPRVQEGKPLFLLSNWLWYARHLPAAVSPALWLILAPPAVWGWWKFFPGKRAGIALYLLLPYFLYSLILGVRWIEFLSPSIIAFFLLAVIGMASVKRAWLRWGLIAICLMISIGHLGRALDRSSSTDQIAPDTWQDRILGGWYNQSPEPEAVGNRKLIRRLVSIVNSTGKPMTIGMGVLGHGEPSHLSFLPLLQTAPAGSQAVFLKTSGKALEFPVDLWLIQESGWAPFEPSPEFLRRYREGGAFVVERSETLRVFLPIALPD